MKLILFLLILALLLSAWLFPSVTPALSVALLLFSLGFAVFVLLKKHRTAYLQGRITRRVFVRNMLLDILGILLAVALAVLLAHYIAGIIAKPIRSDTPRLLAVTLIGLLAGIGVGMFVNRIWGRLTKISSS